MEWADLPIVDISKAATPEGRAALAPQVRDAMRTHGFFYIINHGYTQAQVRQLVVCCNRVRLILVRSDRSHLRHCGRPVLPGHRRGEEAVRGRHQADGVLQRVQVASVLGTYRSRVRFALY